MNRRNYQKELDQIISSEEGRGRAPRLLLHSCCAPCSSYVLEYLSRYFRITIDYYNPNIYPPQEFEKRVAEQRYLVDRMNAAGKQFHRIEVISDPYRPEEFYETVRGYEKEPEGGERCALCYELRLRHAAERARADGYDYFTTTLTISPMKRAEKLNEIGERLAREYGVAFLPSDFKKRNGYKRSVELSCEYGLYRQDYCGCVFSMRERDMRERNEGG